MTSATLAEPASRPSLGLHGVTHLAVTPTSVRSYLTGGNEETVTVLRSSGHDYVSVIGHTEDCPQRAIRGRNCATGDVLLSPQRLTARAQRRGATATNSATYRPTGKGGDSTE